MVQELHESKSLLCFTGRLKIVQRTFIQFILLLLFMFSFSFTHSNTSVLQYEAFQYKNKQNKYDL